MARASATETRSHCSNCGFEASDESAWDRVETPQLGTLTRCPECGSTKVTVVS